MSHLPAFAGENSPNTCSALKTLKVNDDYSGTASEIRAGSFIREPVTRFIAAQGQTLKSTTPITSIVVLGTTAGGKPLRIPYGKPAWY
jgi:hypothetical protein